MEGVVAAYPAQQSSRTLVEAQVGTSDRNGNREAGTGKEKGAAVQPIFHSRIRIQIGWKFVQ